MIVDAHLDLAYCALRYGRDLTRPLADIRAIERHYPNDNGLATVTLPELQRGRVGLVFSTLFPLPAHEELNGNFNQIYRTPAGAKSVASQQLDYYHRLADEQSYIRLVGDNNTLQEVLKSQETAAPLLGLVPLMEGADPLLEPEELEEWVERGLRMVGPAWQDTKYTTSNTPQARHGFTKEGHHLLEVMADLNLILDLSHLSEKAVNEALERYEGQVVATHANCRALAPHVEQRNLTDTQIVRLGERGGVLGIVLYNRFLKKGHLKGERKELVTLDHVVAHIDHVCQLLGSADYVGLGSDFDGGFGWADSPAELNSIADLALIGEKLKERGYDETSIKGVLGENWVRLLGRVWP